MTWFIETRAAAITWGGGCSGSRRGWRLAPAKSTSRAFCQPYLDRLAADLGEGIKLSVLDADGVLVLAVAQGRRDYALTATRGQHLPPHAGAAGKLLLAYLPPAELERRLAEPLAALRRARSPIRSAFAPNSRGSAGSGWAQDKGENAPSILAYRRAGAWRPTAGCSRRSACRSSREPRRSGWRRSARPVVDAARAITAALPGAR